ncbi:hypothetical protein G3M48_003387 [Beauveria asiatica]|uniref:Uncharacterized protein n=1 Tax=Beauveria asiatica TaxID=1069075 RepID=A0AAW0RWG0_9HYPO
MPAGMGQKAGQFLTAVPEQAKEGHTGRAENDGQNIHFYMQPVGYIKHSDQPDALGVATLGAYARFASADGNLWHLILKVLKELRSHGFCSAHDCRGCAQHFTRHGTALVRELRRYRAHIP